MLLCVEVRNKAAGDNREPPYAANVLHYVSLGLDAVCVGGDR